MVKIAYIPARGVDPRGRGYRCRNARYWTGGIEQCDEVTVHPSCRNKAAIEAAYSAHGITVAAWDIPDAPVHCDNAGIREGMWQGEDVVIVGGGPSLRGFDFARLRDFPCKVIATNRAYEVCDPDIVYGMDVTQFFQWAKAGRFGQASLDKWQALTCPIVCCANEPFTGDRRVVNIGRNKSHNLNKGLLHGIHAGSHSGHGALHLAKLSGAKRVYLLGYDARSTGGNTQHWHSGYQKTQEDRVYQRFTRETGAVAEQIMDGMQVINCNPDSGFRCFPFGGLPDGPLHPTGADVPPVLCYVTPDYKLIFSEKLWLGLDRHNIDYTLDERDLPDGTGWREATCEKPAAIRQARRGTRRGIVWLDADSTLERVPCLFGALERDSVSFAAYTLPSGEMLSSVLYFGPDKTATKLLADWQRRCDNSPAKYGTGDQRHLQDAVEQMGITPYQLPATYCKIFDHRDQQHVKEPAIIQWQASRGRRK